MTSLLIKPSWRSGRRRLHTEPTCDDLLPGVQKLRRLSTVDVEELMLILGRPEAGGGDAAPDELARRRPHRSELVASRVVIPDVGDEVNVDHEQMKLARHRMPTEVSAHGHGITLLSTLVVHLPGRTAQLELTLTTITVADDTVDQDPIVAEEVLSLTRPPQHRQPEPTVHQVRLDRTETGRTVPPNRHDEDDTR
jgi:hypothetical protein